MDSWNTDIGDSHVCVNWATNSELIMLRAFFIFIYIRRTFWKIKDVDDLGWSTLDWFEYHIIITIIGQVNLHNLEHAVLHSIFKSFIAELALQGFPEEGLYLLAFIDESLSIHPFFKAWYVDHTHWTSTLTWTDELIRFTIWWSRAFLLSSKANPTHRNLSINLVCNTWLSWSRHMRLRAFDAGVMINLMKVAVQALSFHGLLLHPVLPRFLMRHTGKTFFQWSLWLDDLNIWFILLIKSETSSIYCWNIIVPGIHLIEWYDWSVKSSVNYSYVFLSRLSIWYVWNISVSRCISVQLAVCGYLKHSWPLKLGFIGSSS